MSAKILKDLGLTVRENDGMVEADLELELGQLVNPLTRKFLSKATFTLLGDRLLAIDPPELVGFPAILVTRIARSLEIENQLVTSLNEHIFQLSRRSAELTAMGISPKVDPESLSLTAEVAAGSFSFVIAADKQGNFRVARARRGDDELTTSSVQAFELSEFREKSALEGYLQALFGELQAPRDEAAPAAPGALPLVTLGDIVTRFGDLSVVPPKSTLEILAELKVGGKPYRFAAARVAGRTFRGLLAGTAGRVWAERFEIDDFPGVPELVAKLLSVPIEDVELVGPDGIGTGRGGG
ncbi:MAG: hypothetical protein ACYC8T_01285 [Myxococcaceae bacterium]